MFFGTDVETLFSEAKPFEGSRSAAPMWRTPLSISGVTALAVASMATATALAPTDLTERLEGSNVAPVTDVGARPKVKVASSMSLVERTPLTGQVVVPGVDETPRSVQAAEEKARLAAAEADRALEALTGGPVVAEPTPSKVSVAEKAGEADMKMAEEIAARATAVAEAPAPGATGKMVGKVVAATGSPALTSGKSPLESIWSSLSGSAAQVALLAAGAVGLASNLGARGDGSRGGGVRSAPEVLFGGGGVGEQPVSMTKEEAIEAQLQQWRGYGNMEPPTPRMPPAPPAPEPPAARDALPSLDAFLSQLGQADRLVSQSRGAATDSAEASIYDEFPTCVYCDGSGQILCGHCLGKSALEFIDEAGSVACEMCTNCDVTTGSVVCINCQGSGRSVPEDFIDASGEYGPSFTTDDYVSIFDEAPIPRVDSSAPVVSTPVQQPVMAEQSRAPVVPERPVTPTAAEQPVAVATALGQPVAPVALAPDQPMSMTKEEAIEAQLQQWRGYGNMEPPTPRMPPAPPAPEPPAARDALPSLDAFLSQLGQADRLVSQSRGAATDSAEASIYDEFPTCVYCDGSGQILCGHCLGKSALEFIDEAGSVACEMCTNCDVTTGSVVCINCQGSGRSVPEDFIDASGEYGPSFTTDDYVSIFDEAPIPRVDSSAPVVSTPVQQPVMAEQPVEPVMAEQPAAPVGTQWDADDDPPSWLTAMRSTHEETKARLAAMVSEGAEKDRG